MLVYQLQELKVPGKLRARQVKFSFFFFKLFDDLKFVIVYDIAIKTYKIVCMRAGLSILGTNRFKWQLYHHECYSRGLWIPWMGSWFHR